MMQQLQYIYSHNNKESQRANNSANFSWAQLHKRSVKSNANEISAAPK